VLKVRLPKET